MVMALDKCIGCHTCSVTCKRAWTNRAGTEYVWFNNVETRPGQGYPPPLRGSGKWKGGWVLNKRGRLSSRAVTALQKLFHDFRLPDSARAERLLRALKLRLPELRPVLLCDDFPG